VALREQKPVLLFSLEMAAQQIAQGMLCSHARVDSSLLRSGRVSEEEFQKLVMAAGAFHEAKIFIDDSADLSALELRTRARRMKAREDIQLVVVDYLQKMHAKQGSKAPESRQLEIAMISSNLKSLAKELNVPVIALAQLNRGAEGREDRRPCSPTSANRARSSRTPTPSWRSTARSTTSPTPRRRASPRCLLLKNRTGPVGNVDMAFIKQYTRFREPRRPPARSRILPPASPRTGNKVLVSPPGPKRTLENVMRTILPILLAFAVGCASGSEWPSASRPYKNRVHTIPGTIEDRGLRRGRRGASPITIWSRRTKRRSGPLYRESGVDLEVREDASQKFNLGWTRPGEWLVYTVDVKEAARTRSR
jgi:hypothetical protein